MSHVDLWLKFLKERMTNEAETEAESEESEGEETEVEETESESESEVEAESKRKPVVKRQNVKPAKNPVDSSESQGLGNKKENIYKFTQGKKSEDKYSNIEKVEIKNIKRKD